MADTDVSAKGTPETAERLPKGGSRGAVVRFAAVFLVSATAMLAGYDLAEQTTANDWYLLQVANSCRVLLDCVGYSCEVGRLDRFAGRESEIRSTLAAWREETKNSAARPSAARPSAARPSAARPPAARPSAARPSVAPSAAPPAPLTLWECWQYEAGLRRRTAATNGASPPPRLEPFGPNVHFVLKPGLHRQLADARKRLADLEAGPAQQPDAAVAVHKQVERLQQEIARTVENGKPAPADTAFSFMVVPDCGAVQILAIYVAAVLAFPSPWLARAVGALAGSVLLFWVNAVRLMVLAIAGALDNGGPVYRFMHEYLWQAVYIVFVLAVWLLWVAWATRPAERR